MKHLKINKKGFTIIEVMIVLAIAASIMLVLFLAVPALQRNQRNTQRKANVSAIAGAINEYEANYNGALPTYASGSTNPYKLCDTSGCTSATKTVEFNQGYYTVVPGLQSSTTFTLDDTKAIIITGAKCVAPASGSLNYTVTGGASKSSAVVFQVETGGTLTTSCQDV